MAAVQETTEAQDPIGAAERYQARNERGQRLALRRLGLLPIEPGNLVVLAVGVVVAALGAAELVATEQHWGPEREEQRREHRALHPTARRENLFVLGRSLDSPVVGISFAAAVLPVRLVVALRIAHEVGEGEAVVRGDVVDRFPRAPRLAVENVA